MQRLAHLYRIKIDREKRKEAETELRMMQLRTAGTPLLVGGDISKPTGRSVKSDLDAGNIVVKGIDTNAIQNNLDYVDSISAIGFCYEFCYQFD